MINHVTLMGRMCAEPELRYTPSQAPVVNFAIAVDRDYTDKDGNRTTDFINCVAWNKTAEFISKYFRKGQMMIVTGTLQTRTYQDKNGTNRREYEVRTDSVYFGETKRREE